MVVELNDYYIDSNSFDNVVDKFVAVAVVGINDDFVDIDYNDFDVELDIDLKVGEDEKGDLYIVFDYKIVFDD